MFFQRAPILLSVHLQFPPASIAELKLKQSRGTATRQQFSAARKRGCDAFEEKKKKKRAENKKAARLHSPKVLEKHSYYSITSGC